MGKILMFGGLSWLGKPIIEQLLGEGDEVLAVRTFSDDRSHEDEIEMFFGRHAFFYPMDNDWTEGSRYADTVVFLDGTTFLSPDDVYVDYETMMNRMTTCLEICPELRTIIVLSHIDIYGQTTGEINERTPVSPETDRGRHVDRVERGVIETLLHNKEKARRICLTICRLPNLYTNHYAKDDEAMRVEDVAKGICALLQTNLGPGIEVVQLTSGKEVVTDQGMVKYSFEKARRLINFKPQQDE